MKHELIIDFHTHIVSEDERKNWEEYSERERYLKEEGFTVIPERDKRLKRGGVTVVPGRPLMVGAEQLVRSMDKAGLDMSVVSGFPWTDHDLIVKTNDYVIESVEKYPDRLIGFAQVNPLAGEKAVEEIERCVTCGLKGIGELEWVQQWLSLNPNAMRLIAKVANEYRIPILIHTGEPIGPERLRRAGRGKTFPSLIYRLARDFPRITIVSAHWGGGLFFYELIPDVKEVTTNVFYDTAASPIIYKSKIFRIASEICPNRILFGTDHPLIDQGELINQIKNLDLPNNITSNILGENARRVLKI